LNISREGDSTTSLGSLLIEDIRIQVLNGMVLE